MGPSPSESSPTPAPAPSPDLNLNANTAPVSVGTQQPNSSATASLNRRDVPDSAVDPTLWPLPPPLAPNTTARHDDMDVDENEGGGSGSGSARGPAEVPSGTEGAEEEEQSNTSSDDQKKGKQRAKWGNEQHKLG